MIKARSGFLTKIISRNNKDTRSPAPDDWSEKIQNEIFSSDFVGRPAPLDPRTEQDLRKACAGILQDLKPSGHDVEDTRMKSDMLLQEEDRDGSHYHNDVPRSNPQQRSTQHRQSRHQAVEAQALTTTLPPPRISQQYRLANRDDSRPQTGASAQTQIRSLQQPSVAINTHISPISTHESPLAPVPTQALASRQDPDSPGQRMQSPAIKDMSAFINHSHNASQDTTSDKFVTPGQSPTVLHTKREFPEDSQSTKGNSSKRSSRYMQSSTMPPHMQIPQRSSSNHSRSQSLTSNAAAAAALSYSNKFQQTLDPHESELSNESPSAQNQARTQASPLNEPQSNGFRPSRGNAFATQPAGSNLLQPQIRPPSSNYDSSPGDRTPSSRPRTEHRSTSNVGRAKSPIIASPSAVPAATSNSSKGLIEFLSTTSPYDQRAQVPVSTAAQLGSAWPITDSATTVSKSSGDEHIPLKHKQESPVAEKERFRPTSRSSNRFGSKSHKLTKTKPGLKISSPIPSPRPDNPSANSPPFARPNTAPKSIISSPILNGSSPLISNGPSDTSPIRSTTISHNRTLTQASALNSNPTPSRSEFFTPSKPATDPQPSNLNYSEQPYSPSISKSTAPQSPEMDIASIGSPTRTSQAASLRPDSPMASQTSLSKSQKGRRFPKFLQRLGGSDNGRKRAPAEIRIQGQNLDEDDDDYWDDQACAAPVVAFGRGW